MRTDVTIRPLVRVATIARLELRKILVTRGSAVVLAVTLGVGALFAVGALLIAGRTEPGITQASLPLVALAVAVAVGAPLIGVLVMTSDWHSRETMTIFALEPRRGLVFAGKLAATVVCAAVITVVVGLLAIVMALVVSLATGSELGWSNVASSFGLLVVVSVVGSVNGSALAALIMNTPLAVVVVILQPLVIDTALGFVPGIGSYLQASAFSNFLIGEGAIGPAMAALLLWIALPLALGRLRWQRTEVR